LFIKVPKGTQDILPEDISKWYYIEDMIKEILNKYGYKEIRTPFFEYTDLFVRGIGESTDIVTKEMFTFPDRKGRSLTLINSESKLLALNLLLQMLKLSLLF
jgi:histidyl-tRNA synthetase